MNELSSCDCTPQQSSEDSAHAFILRSIDGSKRVIEDVEIDLSPNHQGSRMQATSLAVFNGDHKPYTPAFIEGTQQAHLASRDEDYKLYFQSKVRHSKGLEIADPRKAKSESSPFDMTPNSDFCLICHETFGNYFKHIVHPIHTKKIEKSIGKQYIEEIVYHVNEQSERKDRERVFRAGPSRIKKRRREGFAQRRHETALSERTAEKGQENMHQTMNFQSKSQLLIKGQTFDQQAVLYQILS